MRFDAVKMKHVKTAPNKSITVDLRTTCIDAVSILVSDFMRIKKWLQCCAMDYEILASHWPSAKDGQHVRKVEGVLDLVCYLATVIQHENYHMVAHSLVFKLNL